MKFSSFLAIGSLAIFSLLPAGCVSPPRGVQPVSKFDVTRYLGTWYEIARLDHSFERGLTNITATYSPGEDGKILIKNRGYDVAKGEWRTVEGFAVPWGPPGQGSLTVRLGAPFDAGYHVIALDRKHYRHAMVSGPTRNYLWILSRQPTLPANTLRDLIAQAKALGYDTSGLITVEHGSVPGSPSPSDKGRRFAP